MEARIVLSWPTVANVLSGTASTTITGTVYEDADQNGVKSSGENGVSGWTVYLDLDHSGTLNTDADGVLEPSAVTNGDGDFTIDHLMPGTYRLSEVVQSGWEPTSPVSQDIAVVKDKDTKADFFNFNGGGITGTVWNDLNGDGVRDTDPTSGAFTDPGLAGWTVFLDLNNNRQFDPSEPNTITDANGEYVFTNLPPDDYEVTEVLPDGWEVSPSFDTRQTASVVGGTTVSQDFANFTLLNGSISGVVWNDQNADGVRQTDPSTGAFTEPGLEGWTVFLDLNTNGTLDPSEPSTVTNSAGEYTFVSVPAGDYDVVEVLQDGWDTAPTFDIQQTVAVNPGEASVADDFANFTVLNGSLKGTIWNDLNRNGVRDATLAGTFTEPGLAGWTVFLDLNHNYAYDPTEPSTLTDASGNYTFTDLQVADYRVQEILPIGWEAAPGFDDNYTVPVFSGTESVIPDFANFNIATATAGSVSGTVWDDQNGNGIRDVVSGTGAFAEPGLSGRTVYVDLNLNGILDASEPKATTGADGSYTIPGVLPGSLRIVALPAPGWHSTAPLTSVYTLSLKNGENVSGLDFGQAGVRDASIQGVVFADTSKDGTRQAGERGLDGLTVYLDLNNSGTLDPGEPQTVTSADQFFTPSVDESGAYSFTHLASGTYTVRVILPEIFSATSAGQRVQTLSLASSDARTGVDFAAQFRPNEIHGVAFDDSNGNHQKDPDELPVGGTTLFVDLNRDDVLDSSEPTTVSAPDGSYSFTGLSAGAYVVRQVLQPGHETTTGATGGILWPQGTSNPAVGNVTPNSITTSLATGESYHQTVSITLPNTGALTNLVDVFLLFDDTGSFVNNSPIVRAAFPDIIAQLQASLPGIDLGFGVGRFEEYANFASEYATGRPFVLNQPIVAASTPGYMTSIQAALNRTTPGYGGDQPETDIEALYQLVTGLGFDGNNNGSVMDSGAAGLVSTQLNPGNSGDVPSFASFTADASGSVLPAAGNVGGGGFRTGALPIILTATDTGFAYQPKGETSITGVGGLTLPLSSFTQTSRPTTPFNSGAGLQQTITALNALGAMVIGLGTNPQANLDPRQGLESLSKLTGAVNHSANTIANGTADPIAPGDPLYFQISSGFATSVANGVVNAIQNAVTNVAVDITVQASDPRVKIINHTGTRNGIGSGQTATFDIEFVGDGIPHRFDLQFVRAGTNVVLGSIPVVIGTPIPGDGYEFEDLHEGEIDDHADFGSRLATNSPPTATVHLSPSSPEGNAVLTASVSSSDPDGNTVGLSYVWKLNGVAILGETGSTFDLSQPGHGGYGDTITVEVTPNDGQVNGLVASDQVTVVDHTPPTSTVSALPTTSLSPSFAVSWLGQDNAGGSGLATFSVYVSDNGGAFTPWLTGTTATTATYAGAYGHSYGFYSVATDAASITQATPASAQATTTVVSASTTTTIASSSTSSIYGDSVTFTATVSIAVGDATPTGTVQFLIDGVDFGSLVLLVGGVATSDSISTLSAGSHTITTIYSGDALYPASNEGGLSLSVSKAHLTLTADNKDMGHGDPVPSLTYQISGFVNGDSASVISGSPTLTTLATSASAAGQYAITVAPGSLTASNYDFPNLVAGTLAVHPKVVDVRVSWGSRSMSILGLTRDLPFSTIKAIDVIFSDDVSVDAADLSLASTLTAGKTYLPSGFSYNPATHDATWTLPNALDFDKLRITLDGDAAGHDGIRAPGGLYLGAYSANFAVLPGDFNGDNQVNSQDLVGIRNGILGVLDHALDVWADINGDGKIDINDYNTAKKYVGKRI